MALLALVLALFSFTLFSVGGETPTSGMGSVVPASQVTPAATRAKLSVKTMRPLRIAGRGFKRGERVRITGAARLTVRASRKGMFSTLLRGVDACESATIRAVGSEGSRATLVLGNVSSLHCIEPQQ